MPHFILSQAYPASGALPNTNPSIANGYDFQYMDARSATRVAYTQNYSVGFQWQFAPQTVLAADYVGNYASRLGDAQYGSPLTQLNQLPFSDLTEYGDALQDTLSMHPEIPLPYPGFDVNNSVGQALRRFPQYGSLTAYDPNVGWSHYDSLRMQLTRRISRGFQLLAAYTWSKVMTNVGSTPQDVDRRYLEDSIASFNYPQTLKLTYTYELPIGRGRWINLASKPLNALVGGWTLSANQRYSSGNPLAIVDSNGNSGIFGSVRPNFTGQPIVLHNPGFGSFDVVTETSTAQYLNRAAFASVPVGPVNSVSLGLGNVPVYLPKVRGPASDYEAFGLTKTFKWGEKRDIAIRADAFNAFNRAGRWDPDTDISSPTFGQVTGPADGPRIIQFNVRIHF